MNGTERLVAALQRHRWLALFLLVLSAVVATRGALNVGVNNSLEIWFVEDDPQFQTYQEFQKDYGNDEVVVLALRAEDGILNQEGMDQLHRLTATAESIDGIAEATSLAKARGLDGGDEGLDISALYHPDQPVSSEQLHTRVTGNPLLMRRLLSEDTKTALVIAKMSATEEIDAVRDGVLAELRAAVTATGLPVRTAGMGVIYSALNELSMQDSQVFIASSNVLIFVVLALLFRRVVPILVTLGVVGLASLWMMGLYGAAGKSINMVTMVLPTLMLIIGVSDCVHFLGHAARSHEGEQRDEKVRKSLAFMMWPCLMNSLTTAAGFASLALAPMPVVRDLGIFAAFGVLGAFVAAFAGCTIALTWPQAEPSTNGTKPLRSAVKALARLASRRPEKVLLGGFFALLLAGVGITQLNVDTYSIGFLKDSHPVVQDSDAIEADYGPYTPLEFLVRLPETLESDSAPAVLRAVAAWQDKMEELPSVGWTQSYVDGLRRLEQIWTDGSPQSYRLPADDTMLSQLMLSYEPSGDPGLPQLLSEDQSTLRVTVGVPMGSARQFEAQISTLRGLAELPEDAELEVTGYLPLYVSMMDAVVESQLSSFSMAFCIIFVMLALLFRSLSIAAYAVPANLLPVVIILGVMGAAGIALDVATVTISAIVLGLVVDDTTQFLYRYRHERLHAETAEEAIEKAVIGAGQAMAATSLALGVGFLVLTFTAVKSIAFFGLLCTLALLVALLSDLLILPATLLLLQRR